MFDELQLNPQEVLLYIAELYIRNMKSLETISLLKSQLAQIEEYKNIASKANEERNNAVILANKYEAQIYELQTKIKQLEEEIASYKRNSKNKKGSTK